MTKLINQLKHMTDEEYIQMVREPVLVRPIVDIYSELVTDVKKILTC
jgi:hypothetical protein